MAAGDRESTPSLGVALESRRTVLADLSRVPVGARRSVRGAVLRGNLATCRGRQFEDVVAVLLELDGTDAANCCELGEIVR